MTSHALHLLRRVSFIHIVILYIPYPPCVLETDLDSTRPSEPSLESLPACDFSPLTRLHSSHFPSVSPDYLSPILFSVILAQSYPQSLCDVLSSFLISFISFPCVLSFDLRDVQQHPSFLHAFPFPFSFSVWT